MTNKLNAADFDASWVIDTLACTPTTAETTSPESARDFEFWRGRDWANCMAWDRGARTFLTISGTDFFCAAAGQSIIDRAFTKSIEELDDDVVRYCTDIIGQAESTKPDRFDDVWLRNLAWLQCTRHSVRIP